MNKLLIAPFIMFFLLGGLSCGTKKKELKDNSNSNSNTRYIHYSRFKFKAHYPEEIVKKGILSEPPDTSGGLIELTLQTPEYHKNSSVLSVSFVIKNTGQRDFQFNSSQSFIKTKTNEHYVHNKVSQITVPSSKSINGQLQFKLDNPSTPFHLYFLLSKSSQFNLILFTFDDIITI